MVVPVSASHAVDGPLWWALREDIRLAGTARPTANTDFGAMQVEHRLDAMVSLVENNLYECSPMELYVFPLEDLYGGVDPCDSAAEIGRVIRAVTKIRELLDQQQGVVVHCEGGTGRTGTVIGSVLVSYGIPAAEVATWLDEVHHLRGRPGWPESPWQREALSTFTPFAVTPEVGQPSPFAPPGTNR